MIKTSTKTMPKKVAAPAARPPHPIVESIQKRIAGLETEVLELEKFVANNEGTEDAKLIEKRQRCRFSLGAKKYAIFELQEVIQSVFPYLETIQGLRGKIEELEDRVAAIEAGGTPEK